jgi:hypothetical protein
MWSQAIEVETDSERTGNPLERALALDGAISDSRWVLYTDHAAWIVDELAMYETSNTDAQGRDFLPQ